MTAPARCWRRNSRTTRRRWPWGSADPEPALANLGGGALRPAPVGAYPAGASAYGAEQLIALLLALDALIDGAAVADAERTLAERGSSPAVIKEWDPQRVARVRRRLINVRTDDPGLLLDRLRSVDLIG